MRQGPEKRSENGPIAQCRSMYLDGERVGSAVGRKGTTSQEDGRFMTVVVDGDLDIVVGEFRDVTKVADGATEVCIHRQDLVFCYIQRVIPRARRFYLLRQLQRWSGTQSTRQTGWLRDSFDEAAAPHQQGQQQKQ